MSEGNNKNVGVISYFVENKVGKNNIFEYLFICERNFIVILNHASKTAIECWLVLALVHWVGGVDVGKSIERCHLHKIGLNGAKVISDYVDCSHTWSQLQ